MASRIVARAFALVGCGALFACTLNNNTSVPPAPNNPAPVFATANEPANDSNDHLLAGCVVGHPWDVGTIQAQRIGPPGNTYTELVVSVSFEQENPNDGVPDLTAFSHLNGPGQAPAPCDGSLAGGLVINTGATGINADCGPIIFPHISFVVNLGGLFHQARLPDGNAGIYNTSMTQTGEAQITGGGNVVTFTIPISAIGGSSSGPFSVAAGFSNGTTITDCAPIGGELADSGVMIPLSNAVAAGTGGFQILETP